MRTTSITHCKNSNYQSDFGGYKLEDVCSAFEKYEQRMEAIWGALFEESSGKLLATYSKESGLNVLEKPYERDH
jgi:hypothetical protein